EGPQRDIEIDLRPVTRHAGAIGIEGFSRHSARIGFGLQHQRGDRLDQHRFRYPSRVGASDIVGHFATAGRMTDMNGTLEIELGDELLHVVGVGVHVVAEVRLGGTSMAAPVVRDHAIALSQEVHQLRIPVVRAERPAVMENDRLSCLGTPVLVENFSAVAGRDEWHGKVPPIRESAGRQDRRWGLVRERGDRGAPPKTLRLGRETEWLLSAGPEHGETATQSSEISPALTTSTDPSRRRRSAPSASKPSNWPDTVVPAPECTVSWVPTGCALSSQARASIPNSIERHDSSRRAKHPASSGAKGCGAIAPPSDAPARSES